MLYKDATASAASGSSSGKSEYQKEQHEKQIVVIKDDVPLPMHLCVYVLLCLFSSCLSWSSLYALVLSWYTCNWLIDIAPSAFMCICIVMLI